MSIRMANQLAKLEELTEKLLVQTANNAAAIAELKLALQTKKTPRKKAQTDG